MLNEFTYCPRLFYLEWVQGEFRDSIDTVEGRWQHRNVERPRGRLAKDGDEVDRSHEARAVRLASERYGIVGVVDVVETSGQMATPIDYKRGSTPPQGPWDPERVQLCAQALLLRDNGYECNEGVIYFAGSRERVRVEITDALVEKTLDVLAQARETAASGRIPSPLLDSPKCPRCSLVGICLPDETNELSGRSGDGAPPRRLIPKRELAHPIYVQEQGARVGKRGERLVIEAGDERVERRLLDVSQLCVFGNVRISAQALRMLARNGRPICHFSYGGWLDAVTTGADHKNVELRLAQFQAATDPVVALAVSRHMVDAKIRNARTLLRRNHPDAPEATLRELARLARSARNSNTVERLLGLEGAAARTYFAQFADLIRVERFAQEFRAAGRNRRPPTDPVNALLSFAYALLVKDLHVQVRAAGFDPYLGLYHQPKYGKPALALDLAEEFRPVIADSVVVSAINNGELSDHDFLERGDAVALTPSGRKAFLAAYERRVRQEIRHPRLGYSVPYRRIFEVQARLLGRHLLSEIPDYEPFRVR